MFNLVFGLFWTIVSAICLASSISVAVSDYNDKEIIWAILLSGGFVVIGVIFVFFGIKKIVRDKRTDKYGEICYARITDVKYNGNSTNGAKYYDAYARVYVESRDEFVEAHDDIGKDPMKYPVDSYVAVRFLDGDVNFEYVVPSFDGLPMHIRDKFDNGQIIPDDV